MKVNKEDKHRIDKAINAIHDARKWIKGCSPETLSKLEYAKKSDCMFSMDVLKTLLDIQEILDEIKDTE